MRSCVLCRSCVLLLQMQHKSYAFKVVGSAQQRASAAAVDMQSSYSAVHCAVLLTLLDELLLLLDFCLQQ
jgi:hypothetical protein